MASVWNDDEKHAGGGSNIAQAANLSVVYEDDMYRNKSAVITMNGKPSYFAASATHSPP